MAGRVVAGTMWFLERRIPRRNLLTRAAVAASALAVAPVRYLTRPVSAETLITCSDCSPGSLCCAGYTAFCCQLPGGTNTRCPPGAFVGGWWKCTNYAGSGLCDSTNVRYYLDCNELPGHSCQEQCARGN